MLTAKIRRLETTRAKIAQLERSIADEMRSELAALPGRYGFDSVAAFVKALRAAAGRGRTVKSAPVEGKRRRAVITDATRASVKRLVGEGKNGGQIARALKISLPSVQNIKKALGLVKKR